MATLSKPGRHSDGGGLYLVVDPSGARRWLFLFRWGGKLKELGLGGISTASLAEARDKAAEARRQVKAGTNPIEARRTARAAEAGAQTFGQVADALLASITPGFRNEKHRAQWVSTLATYAAPLRSIPIDKISTNDVLGVLQPIWLGKPETASRVRGRIERIIDAARAKGLRSAENPARWRGHLDHLLPRRSKVQQKHHSAMPHERVASFMSELRNRTALTARALEFVILTAGRTEEVLQARWNEIDRASKIWIVPGTRMKAGRDHRVPLTDRALEILDEVARLRDGEFVFPGQRRDRPLSNTSMLMLMRRLGADDFTVHGFRSSFRDWAGDCTSFPSEVAEAALAHVVGDKAEQAYRRSDALAKRRELMDAWAGYLGPREAKVVRLSQKKIERS